MYLRQGAIQTNDPSVSQDIIQAISDEPCVRTLSLAHSKLGDAACSQVFTYLSAQYGKTYGATEIDLRHCAIGDDGLKAISQFLTRNYTLRTLLLQGVRA